MKTTYGNYKNLFELIRTNKNADKIIFGLPKKMGKSGWAIYLNKEYGDDKMTINLSFNNDRIRPNFQFILSCNNPDLEIIVSSSSDGRIFYDEFIEVMQKHKKEALKILMQLNLEMAFDSKPE